MKVILAILILAGSLALLLHGAELALACPDDLVCGNFTYYDKIETCEQVMDQGLEEGEEQDVLCILWEQGYDYDGYQPPEYPPLDPELALQAEEIDNGALILAGKIVIFMLLNYFLFSYLTKSSIFTKWLQ